MANTTLTATVRVVDDATTPLGKIQDAMQKAGASEEEINKKIAGSQLLVEMAQKGRLSTSDQLKFSMQAEAAKGDELATQLVTLERDYAILVKQMQAMARYGVEIPQGMIAQANAARQAADAIKEKTAAVKALDDPMAKTFERFRAAGIASQAFTLATRAAKEAVAVWVKDLIDGATALEDLGREATTTEKALGSVKKVMADEDWSKQAWYTQALTVGMAALNTQLAEAEARVAVRNKLVQAGKQDQAAMNAVIDEEAAKTSGNAENGKRVIDALNKFREKAHADEKKRSTERKQIALENAQAELDIAAEYNQRLIKEASDTENEIARIKKKQRDANREWAEFWAKSDEKRENEIVENAKKAAAAKKAIQQKDNTDKLQMIDQMTAATTQAATAWASGEMKGADAAKSAVKGTVTAAIQMAAAKASAQAMAAYSGIPFVGVALGIAAAATLATMILGYLTKFHTGGVVGSGDGQRLPGMASNERAITVKVGEEVRTQEQQRAGSGGGVVINARSLFAPTAADTKRMVNQVSKLQRRQRRLGYA